jgi:putative aldouronate transport system permease protein
VAQTFIFRYLPIAGLYISFVDYDLVGGIFSSRFVGLKWFKQLFSGANFYSLLKNSLILSFCSIVFTFPAPIILAISFNELASKVFKRVAQTISYMPYFISVVVIVGIMSQLLSPSGGLINEIIQRLGFQPMYFMTSPQWFRPLYIISDIWQNTGWTAIIYLASITSISEDLYEAAKIDGAGRLQRIWHVTIPGILPTIIVLFLLKVGHSMELGYEKVLLMYSPQIYEVADIFDTFVYRRGIISMDYSFATTMGLFKALVSFVLVVCANKISNKAADIGLW